MQKLFREQLLAAAEQAVFPAERTPDPVTGLEVFEPESVQVLSLVFELFGVTGLSPHDADANKVINTACTLAAEVANHVQSLTATGGALDALPESANWHPAYRGYIAALWQGDRAEVARCAAQLNLLAGIPNGSLALEDGPLT